MVHERKKNFIFFSNFAKLRFYPWGAVDLFAEIICLILMSD